MVLAGSNPLALKNRISCQSFQSTSVVDVVDALITEVAGPLLLSAATTFGGAAPSVSSRLLVLLARRHAPCPPRGSRVLLEGRLVRPVVLTGHRGCRGAGLRASSKGVPGPRRPGHLGGCPAKRRSSNCNLPARTSSGYTEAISSQPRICPGRPWPG